MNFKQFWQLCHPRFWVMNYSLNKNWDELLNQLLDAFEPAQVTEHTALFGHIGVWVSNYPYAYGTLWAELQGPGCPLNRVEKNYYLGRPRRTTILRLKEAMDRVAEKAGSPAQVLERVWDMSQGSKS